MSSWEDADLTQVADRDLMARLATGDARALGFVYDRHGSAAFGLALRIVRDRSHAEDVVQEAFLGVWRNAGRYDGSRAEVRTWIMAIVHHRSIDVVRKRRPVSDLPVDGPSPAALITPDLWPEVAAHLDGEVIRAALATLGPAQREAIELAYFSGFTQEEIARRTGAPLGTVKSRVRLGLLALRASLAPETTVRPRQTAGRA